MILTWLFGLLSLVGLAATFYYGRKSLLLQSRIRDIDWKDIETAANDLVLDLGRFFAPDLIIAPDVRGGLLAYFVEEKFPASRVLIGITVNKSRNPTPEHTDGYRRLETKNWVVELPDAAFADTAKRILIVDDFALSGDAQELMRAAFLEAGFPIEAVKTATVVTTSVAKNSHKAPDYSWKTVDNADFYLPWGKAR